MNNKLETATLGGGCFWCTEAIFKRLKGIASVNPGYSGGNIPNPTYAAVSNGRTGHAEVIQLEFDPTLIPYDKILDVFWDTHDPTTLNRQGNDVGTQYRSVIFYHNNDQKLTAINSKKKLKLPSEAVTEILPFRNFYSAEDYHKNYFDRNKQEPYCNFIISPKIHKLLSKYGNELKKEYANEDF